MRWGSRAKFAGLVVLGVLVLAFVSYFGIRRYDTELGVLERGERCVGIEASANPAGATEAERAALDRCRRDGETPPVARP